MPSDIKTTEHKIRIALPRASVWHIPEKSHTQARSYLYYTWWDDSSTGAQIAPISALQRWHPGLHPSKIPHRCSTGASCIPDLGAVRPLCITFKTQRAQSICLNYCGCFKLPRISPLTPLSCEGCPHRSALWLPLVLSVPRISSTVKCWHPGPFILLFKLLLNQQNKTAPSMRIYGSWYFKLYWS